jgi:hypothetical protein
MGIVNNFANIHIIQTVYKKIGKSLREGKRGDYYSGTI